MKSNKILWGGAGVIAAAVIVYFAFFYPSPQDTDIQGAIGVVEKYQEEQIKPEDVVLAGEEGSTAGPDASMVIDEIATLLERAPIKDQAACFRAAAPDKQLAIYARADAPTKALVYAQAKPEDQVAVFERINKNIFVAVLARVEMDEKAWGQLTLQKKAAVLEKAASIEEKALMADRVPKPQLNSIFGRIEDEMAAGLVRQASKMEKAALVAAAPEAERKALYEYMPAEKFNDLLARTTLKYKMAALESASRDQQSLMLAQATEVDKAVLFGMASIDKQLELAARGPEKENVAMLMAVATETEKADLWGRGLKPEEQVEVFERGPKHLFNAVLERAAVKDNGWNAMTMEQKRAVLERNLTEPDKANLVERASYDKHAQLVSRATKQMHIAWLGRLGEPERAKLYSYASMEEQFELLKRAPEVGDQLLRRVPKYESASMLTGRAFVDQDVQR